MLLKILKGSSNRISTNTTPFHEGWCYYCSDDQGFYIDSVENGVEKRTRINPLNGSGKSISATLNSTDWYNNIQTITNSHGHPPRYQTGRVCPEGHQGEKLEYYARHGYEVHGNGRGKV